MNKECNWAQYDDEYGAWETDCGYSFMMTEGRPIENGMKFCCSCGGKLTETPYEEPTDE